MDKDRFSRIENRVDEIKDDIAELKADIKIQSNNIDTLSEQFRIHVKLVEKHVAGDTKIINEISPYFGDLKQIIADHKFKQEKNERVMKVIKQYTMYLGLVSLITGILVTLDKLL